LSLLFEIVLATRSSKINDHGYDHDHIVSVVDYFVNPQLWM
jgi:hypothetical protein